MSGLSDVDPTAAIATQLPVTVPVPVGKVLPIVVDPVHIVPVVLARVATSAAACAPGTGNGP